MAKPCKRCNGTGSDSAARCMGMLDLPRSQQPYGVFQCEVCGGSGEEFELNLHWSPEELKVLHRMLIKLKTKLDKKKEEI